MINSTIMGKLHAYQVGQRFRYNIMLKITNNSFFKPCYVYTMQTPQKTFAIIQTKNSSLFQPVGLLALLLQQAAGQQTCSTGGKAATLQSVPVQQTVHVLLMEAKAKQRVSLASLQKWNDFRVSGRSQASYQFVAIKYVLEMSHALQRTTPMAKLVHSNTQRHLFSNWVIYSKIVRK